jgi:excisionase family DNA binding protein
MQTQSQKSEPILASIPETGHQLRVGRTKVYELMDDGELEWVKIGDRRLVVQESIKRLVQRLLQAAT